MGLCLDGPELLSVWKYCGRGSLHDVVNKNDSTMDVFFIHCLLRDILDVTINLRELFHCLTGTTIPPRIIYQVPWQSNLRDVFGRRTLPGQVSLLWSQGHTTLRHQNQRR